MQVAETILKQLGGNRFIAMTGARNFVGSESSLQFGIPAKLTKNGANRVHVELGADDLYTVDFYRLHGLKFSKVSTHEMVYAEDLRRLFTSETGLDTSL